MIHVGGLLFKVSFRNGATSFLANSLQSKFKVYHHFDSWSHEQYIS